MMDNAEERLTIFREKHNVAYKSYVEATKANFMLSDEQDNVLGVNDDTDDAIYCLKDVDSDNPAVTSTLAFAAAY